MDNNIIIDIIMCGYTQSRYLGRRKYVATYLLYYLYTYIIDIYIYDYTLYIVIEKYYIM